MYIYIYTYIHIRSHFGSSRIRRTAGPPRPAPVPVQPGRASIGAVHAGPPSQQGGEVHEHPWRQPLARPGSFLSTTAFTRIDFNSTVHFCLWFIEQLEKRYQASLYCAYNFIQ